MCGIVGYIGHNDAVPVLLQGLKRLEYRGYDSAGVAVMNEQDLVTVKEVGKIRNLESVLAGQPPLGQIGIGHTRWATHGQPNKANAHPHSDDT
ncbi:MAG TPA: glutamine--fructose-6-phosphate aminotransferase, partial [Calditrichaeota bacterium]|nr:glutamine--fructose-6-phosphate aminotransferase [Calditrichota bacterium]